MRKPLSIVALLSALCSGNLLATPPVLTADGLPDDTQYTIVNAGTASRGPVTANTGNTWVTYSRPADPRIWGMGGPGIKAEANHIKISGATWTGDVLKTNVPRYGADGTEAGGAGTPTPINSNSAPMTINAAFTSAASTWFANGYFLLNTNGFLNKAGDLYISEGAMLGINQGTTHTISNPITLGTSIFLFTGSPAYTGANIRIEKPTTFTGKMTIATPSKLAGKVNYAINELSGKGNLTLASSGPHSVKIKDGSSYTGVVTLGADVTMELGKETSPVNLAGSIIADQGNFKLVGSGAKTIAGLELLNGSLQGGASDGTLTISQTLDVSQATTCDVPIIFGDGMTYVAPASGAFIARGITLPANGVITIDTSRLADILVGEQHTVLTTSDGTLDTSTIIQATTGFSATIVGTSIVIEKASDHSLVLEGDTRWSSLNWTDDETKDVLLSVSDTIESLTLTLDEPILAKTLIIRTSAKTKLTIATTDGYTTAPISINTRLALGTVLINNDLLTSTLIAGTDLKIGATQLTTTSLTIPQGNSATVLPDVYIPTIALNDGTLYLKGSRIGINATLNPFFATCGLVVFDDEGRKIFDFTNTANITTQLRFDGTHVTNPDFSFRSAYDWNAFNDEEYGPDKPAIEVINAKVKSITRNIFGYNAVPANATIKLSGTEKLAEIEFHPVDQSTDRMRGRFILDGTTAISSANAGFSFFVSGGDSKPSITVSEGGIAELRVTEGSTGKVGIWTNANPTFLVNAGGTLTASSGFSVADSVNFAFRKTGTGEMILTKPSAGTNPYRIVAGKLTLKETGSLAGSIDLGVGATLNIDASSVAQPFVGAISGAGAVTKGNAGTLTLDQPSTFSGTIALNAGAIEATVPGVLGSAKISLTSGTTLTMWKDTSDLARIQNVASGTTIAVNAPTNLLSEATWAADGIFTLTFALTSEQLLKTDPIFIPLKNDPEANAPSMGYAIFDVINSTSGISTSDYSAIIETDGITITPKLNTGTLTYTPSEEKPNTNPFTWDIRTSFDNNEKYKDLDDVLFKSAVQSPTTVNVGENINPGTLTLDAGYTFTGNPFSVATALKMASTANATDGPLQYSTITQAVTTPLLDVSNGRLNLSSILTPEVVLGEGATLKADVLTFEPPTLIKAMRFIPLSRVGGGGGYLSVAELVLYRNGERLIWSDIRASTTSTGVSVNHTSPALLTDDITTDENSWSFNVNGTTALSERKVYATITFKEPMEMFDAYALAMFRNASTENVYKRGIPSWAIEVSEDGETFREVNSQENVTVFDLSWLGIKDAEGNPIRSPIDGETPDAPSSTFKVARLADYASISLLGKTTLVATGEYNVAITGDGTNPLNFIADAGKMLTFSASSIIENVPSYTFDFDNNYDYRGVTYDVIKWNNPTGLEAILTKSTIGGQPAGFGGGILAVDSARKILTVTWPEQILTWNGTATHLFATNAWTIAGKTTDYAPGNTLLFPSCDVVRTVKIDAPVDATAMIFEAGSRYSFSFSDTGAFNLATPLTISGDVTFNGGFLTSANVTVAEGGKLTIIPSSTLPTQTYTLNGGTLSLQARTDSGSGTTTVLGHGTIEIAPNSVNAKCPINTTGFTGQINLIDVPEGIGVESRKLTPGVGDLTLGDNTTFHITDGPQLYISNTITIAKLFVEGTGSANGKGFGAIRIENGVTFTATTMTLTGDTSIAAGGALNGAIVHALETTPILSLGSITNAAVGDMTVNATIGTVEKPIVIRGYFPAGETKTITFKRETFAEKVLSDGTTCNLVFATGKHAVKRFEAAPTAKPIQILSSATLSLALGKITVAGTMPIFNGDNVDDGDVTLELDGTTFAKGATVIDWTGLTAPTIDFVPPTGVTNTFTSIPTGIAILGVTITGTTDGVLKIFLGDNAPEGARSITIADEAAIQTLNLLGIKPIYTEGEASVYTVTVPVYTFTVGSLDMSVADIFTATYAIKGSEGVILDRLTPTGTFSLLYKTSLTDKEWTSCTTKTNDNGSLSADLTEGMNFFIIQVK